MTKRQKAVIRRNIFLGLCAVILVAVIAMATFLFGALSNKKPKKQDATSSKTAVSENVANSEETSSANDENGQTSSGDTSQPTPHGLDADYTNLMLVNGWNPLPEDFDYEGHLTTIPQKYIKGSLRQIDKDVWPYLKAMLDDAKSEGIDIGVWSPYRSYDTQKWLYEKQINKQIANGIPKDEAPDKAATIVARPGTSEHNTGLALDINCADHSFKNTKGYKWLQENAEDYGFIMRYAEDKQEKTGVIYESWHWRFVGIKAAHEINDLGMCLEEYVEYKK